MTTSMVTRFVLIDTCAVRKGSHEVDIKVGKLARPYAQQKQSLRQPRQKPSGCLERYSFAVVVVAQVVDKLPKPRST